MADSWTKSEKRRLVYNENCWVQGLSVLGLATPTHTFITFRNTVIRSHNNKYVPSDRKYNTEKELRPLSLNALYNYFLRSS